jgi:hypothetical protein
MKIARNGESVPLGPEKRGKSSLFECPVGARQDRRWDAGTESFAVLRLMANANFLGRSTGKSAGLAPLRVLSI